MPIYELSYRGWEGPRTPHWRRWLIIALSDLNIVRRLKFVGFVSVWVLGVLALLPALKPLGLIAWHSGLLASYLGDWVDLGRHVPPVDAALFQWFYDTQWVLVVLLALVAGSGRVANDVRTNAFLFYLSRPLTRLDYVLGKFAAVGGVIAAVSLVPALLLLLLAWLAVPEAPAPGAAAFVLDARLAMAVIVHGVLSALYVAAAVLLASAFSRNALGAAVRFVSLVMLSHIVYGICATVFHTKWAALASFPLHMESVSRWAFGLEPNVELSPAVSLLVVLGVISLGVVALRGRLRAVEVQT